MAQEPQIPLRLRQLINAVCDEVATDAEVRELDGMLRSDKRALQDYLEYCRLHAELHFAVRARKMAARAVNSIVETSAIVKTKSPAATPPVAAAPGSPAKSPVLGFLGGAMDYVNHSRMLMFWLMALTLTGWFAFHLGSLASRRNAQVADEPAEPKSSPPQQNSWANSGSGRAPRV